MLTLVVEDSAERAAVYAGIVAEATGGAVKAAVVASVNEARRALQQSRYDLLLLDCALPRHKNGAVDQWGGLSLLKELLDGPTTHIPTDIVAVTASEEALAGGAAAEFARHGVLLLHVSPASMDWRVSLVARVRHRFAKSSEPAQSLPFQSRLALVCALESPELEAVRRLPFAFVQTSIVGDDAIYWKGQCADGGAVWAASCPTMGPVSAAIVASKMLFQFRPQYIANVGITAGIHGRASIGDVVVADPCWDWGSGKFADHPMGGFLPEMYPRSLDPSVRSVVVEIGRDTSLLAAWWDGWPGVKPPAHPRVLVAPSASGSAVVASKAKRTEISTQHRKLTGIDMEAFAVVSAAYEAPSPRPGGLSVKAVCDFADGKKNDKWQRYCAYVASKAMQEIILRLPTRVS